MQSISRKAERDGEEGAEWIRICDKGQQSLKWCRDSRVHIQLGPPNTSSAQALEDPELLPRNNLLSCVSGDTTLSSHFHQPVLQHPLTWRLWALMMLKLPGGFQNWLQILWINSKCRSENYLTNLWINASHWQAFSVTCSKLKKDYLLVFICLSWINQHWLEMCSSLGSSVILSQKVPFCWFHLSLLCSRTDVTANMSVTARPGLASKGPWQPHKAAKQGRKWDSLHRPHLRKPLGFGPVTSKANSATTNTKKENWTSFVFVMETVLSSQTQVCEECNLTVL